MVLETSEEWGRPRGSTDSQEEWDPVSAPTKPVGPKARLRVSGRPKHGTLTLKY